MQYVQHVHVIMYNVEKLRLPCLLTEL